MGNEATLVGAVKTEQGVELKGVLMQPVVDKCEGCDRIRSFEGENFCSSYPNPARKWFDGRCNFATHIKAESGKSAKVNPLKASKRAAKGRSAVTVLYFGKGEADAFPFFISSAKFP